MYMYMCPFQGQWNSFGTGSFGPQGVCAYSFYMMWIFYWRLKIKGSPPQGTDGGLCRVPIPRVLTPVSGVPIQLSLPVLCSTILISRRPTQHSTYAGQNTSYTHTFIHQYPYNNTLVQPYNHTPILPCAHTTYICIKLSSKCHTPYIIIIGSYY